MKLKRKVFSISALENEGVEFEQREFGIKEWPKKVVRKARKIMGKETVEDKVAEGKEKVEKIAKEANEKMRSALKKTSEGLKEVAKTSGEWVKAHPYKTGAAATGLVAIPVAAVLGTKAYKNKKAEKNFAEAAAAEEGAEFIAKDGKLKAIKDKAGKVWEATKEGLKNAPAAVKNMYNGWVDAVAKKGHEMERPIQEGVKNAKTVTGNFLAKHPKAAVNTGLGLSAAAAGGLVYGGVKGGKAIKKKIDEKKADKK